MFSNSLCYVLLYSSGIWIVMMLFDDEIIVVVVMIIKYWAHRNSKQYLNQNQYKLHHHIKNYFMVERSTSNWTSDLVVLLPLSHFLVYYFIISEHFCFNLLFYRDVKDSIKHSSRLIAIHLHIKLRRCWYIIQIVYIWDIEVVMKHISLSLSEFCITSNWIQNFEADMLRM